MLEMPAQGMRRFWEQGAIALVLALAIVLCQGTLESDRWEKTLLTVGL